MLYFLVLAPSLRQETISSCHRLFVHNLSVHVSISKLCACTSSQLMLMLTTVYSSSVSSCTCVVQMCLLHVSAVVTALTGRVIVIYYCLIVLAMPVTSYCFQYEIFLYVWFNIIKLDSAAAFCIIELASFQK